MPNDLERFLQQAAERLKDKIQQSQEAQRSQQNLPPRRSQQTPPPINQRLEPQVIQATLVSRSAGDDPLSDIDTRPSVGHDFRPRLAENVGQANQRMSGHVHQVFDHTVSSLPSASTALQSTISKTPDQTNSAVEVDRRGHMTSPFLKMLRKPDTLRAAFIAGEIFRRKV